MKIALFAVLIFELTNGAFTLPALTGAREVESLHAQGVELYREGQFVRSAVLFEKAYKAALVQRDSRQAVLNLGNAMSCRFALLQYRTAAELYGKARDLAKQSGDYEGLAVLASNMASLYAHMGDSASAVRLASEARTSFAKAPKSRYYTPFLLQEGIVALASGDHARAASDLRQCIQAAERDNDLPTEARAWELLGAEQWKEGALRDADNSFRHAGELQLKFRKETTPDLERRIGLLLQSEKKPQEALAAFNRALAKSARIANGIPSWLMLYQRGVLFSQTGKHAEAFADLEQAVGKARKWRRTVLPVHSGDQADAGLGDLYTAYLDAGYQQTRDHADPQLLRRLFVASEESRALSLQESLAPSMQWQNRVRPEYWERAAELRNAYAEAAATPSESLTRKIRDLEWLLAEEETRAGLEMRPPGEDAAPLPVSTMLSADEVFISIHLGAQRSYLFAAAGNDLRIAALPSSQFLGSKVDAFRELVKSGSPQLKEEGRKLFTLLFSGLPEPMLRKENWILALDGNLFELPLAALTLPEGSYFVERHSLRVVPNWRWVVPAAENRTSHSLLALGDPVFHSADPRWKWGSQDTAPSALPRLPGSGREVRLCRSVWKGPGVALTGNDATLTRLSQEVRTSPAVLHFATHVVQLDGRSDQPMIALGSGSRAQSEFLTVHEISRFHLSGTLVVLNGCHSGAGAALPRAGWMGLTRAWLAAGAAGVVASYWPTSDDGSAFFAPFYANYQSASTNGRASAAAALRQAQLAMLRSDARRAQPRYWAAYYVTGRN